MKLLWSNLSLGGLYTDANANTNTDADAYADNDNDTPRTEHDCIGSLPNEPKKERKALPEPLLERILELECFCLDDVSTNTLLFQVTSLFLYMLSLFDTFSCSYPKYWPPLWDVPLRNDDKVRPRNWPHSVLENYKSKILYINRFDKRTI